MKFIDYNDEILIPLNKICNMIIEQNDPKVLSLWLDGGQVQKITHTDSKNCRESFKYIRELIKSL